MYVSWIPPPLGVLKINFDASITSDKAAARYIIRDHHGKLIRVGGKRLFTSSVPQAELTAAWLGIFIAMNNHQAQNI